jgi:hypothetical protein
MYQLNTYMELNGDEELEYCGFCSAQCGGEWQTGVVVRWWGKG